jgi:hypothetical protein
MTVDRPSLDSHLAALQPDQLMGLGNRPSHVRSRSVASGPMTPGVTLPAEVHSSAHQVRFEGSLIGEYEVRIYRGNAGPVVILQEGSSSPLPLEYLSEYAVSRFMAALPNSRGRFFERHHLGSREAFVEVILQHGAYRRDPCPPAVVASALAPAQSLFDD